MPARWRLSASASPPMPAPMTITLSMAPPPCPGARSELTTVAPFFKQCSIRGVLVAGEQEGRRIVGQGSLHDVAGDQLSARARRHDAEAGEGAGDVGAFDRNGSDQRPVLLRAHVVAAVDVGAR